MSKLELTLMQKGEFGLLPAPLQYLYNLGILTSQGISTVLGGDPDETLSSRTGKAVVGGNKFAIYVMSPVLDFLFQENNHAINSIEEDEGAKEIWHWSSYYEDKNTPPK